MSEVLDLHLAGQRLGAASENNGQESNERSARLVVLGDVLVDGAVQAYPAEKSEQRVVDALPEGLSIYEVAGLAYDIRSQYANILPPRQLERAALKMLGRVAQDTGDTKTARNTAGYMASSTSILTRMAGRRLQKRLQ